MRSSRQAPQSLPGRDPVDPVVSTQWLADHLEDVALLDVRGHVDTVLVEPGVERSSYHADYDAYLEGHIPGAAFWNWTRDGIDASSPVPVQAEVDAGLFAAQAEAKGVGTDRPVVAYDWGDGMLAARLWWMLRLHGHPAPLVLEGGWRRWVGEQRPTELYEPCPLKAMAAFEPQQPRPELRVTAEELAAELAAASSGGSGGSPLVLIDTRSPQQYAGEVRRGPRAGRIPGARSLPRPSLLDPQAGWLLPDRSALQAALQAAGVAPLEQEGGREQRLVLYCNGGVAACKAALALHQLGHRRVAVYDGSWNEWGARPELPVET